MDAGDYISLAQLVVSLGGGAYALYLFKQSNREKSNTFTTLIYDRFYNDNEIRTLLYSLDKHKTTANLTPTLIAALPPGALPLIKTEEIKVDGQLELAADKALRFLNYIGGLAKDGALRKSDVALFRYEINLFLGPSGGEHMQNYLQHFLTLQVELKDNIDFLTTYFA